ncbi:MAG: sulfatase-like hydrolase/transferase [Myxococcota bacterium]|nr:sulfatase-like hydrolase/transferase [Myxococcota bacterium]
MRLVWLLLFGALLSCRGGEKPPNIVLIVLDTTRSDRLSVYGHERKTSPFLERFGSSGVRFDQAWSVSSWTLPSHATMFTGLHPDEHGATQENFTISEDLDTLAERLKAKGYQTAGFSNNPWVSHRVGLTQGFDHFSEMWVVKKTREKTGRHATLDEIDSWKETVLDDDEPFFVFVNLIEPHLPYSPPVDTGKRFFDSKADYQAAGEHFQGAGKITVRHYQGTNPLTGEEWSDLSALYEGELHRVDQVTRKVLARLEEIREGETVVIITADHGEHHNEHDHLGHVFSLYEPLVHVPMLARGPGFTAGTVRDEPVSLLDIAPTILHIAGADTAGMHSIGTDIRGEISTKRALPLTYGWPQQVLRGFPEDLQSGPTLAAHRRSLRGAVYYPYKLIRGSDGEEVYYDLRKDPDENVPLDTATIPEAIRAAMDSAAGIPAGRSDAAAPDSETLPEDEMDSTTAEELRLLGYIE